MPRAEVSISWHCSVSHSGTLAVLHPTGVLHHNSLCPGDLPPQGSVTEACTPIPSLPASFQRKLSSICKLCDGLEKQCGLVAL